MTALSLRVRRIEQIEFEEVDYWDELKGIMEWTKTHVTSTFHICWVSAGRTLLSLWIGEGATGAKNYSGFLNIA